MLFKERRKKGKKKITGIQYKWANFYHLLPRGFYLNRFGSMSVQYIMHVL